VPNTYEEQARERLTKSLAFLNTSQSLLQDDLLYRSALADAVSSIKNMLQGYLLLRIAATPPSGLTQQWQDIANSNRMPELITACTQAGLDLRGLAVEVKRLNSERNSRTHDDPRRRVDVEQAEYALKVAREVQARIKDAVQGKSTSRSLPARAVERAKAASGALKPQPAISRSGVLPALTTDAFGDTSAYAKTADPLPATPAPGGSSGKLSAPTSATASSPTKAASNGASPTAAAHATTDDIADEVTDDDDSGNTTEFAALASSRTRQPRGRFTSGLLRVVSIAALLILGVVAGVGLTVPVTTGHAPGWLSFASNLLPATSTVAIAPAPTATATPLPAPAPVTLGALVIGAPVCQSGVSIITLTNTGQHALDWAAGSHSLSVSIATKPGGAGQPGQLGTLAPGASLALYVSGSPAAPYTLTITTPAGAVQIPAVAC
jgi:hypothetical protein